MSECEAFRLDKEKQAKEVMGLIEVMKNWQNHFAQVGMSHEDFDSLVLRIDGDFFLGSRRGLGWQN